MPELKFRFGMPDDECLPLTQCVCGVTFGLWDLVLSVYKDDPKTMPCCGRRLYWSSAITVHEVKSPDASA